MGGDDRHNDGGCAVAGQTANAVLVENSLIIPAQALAGLDHGPGHGNRLGDGEGTRGDRGHESGELDIGVSPRRNVGHDGAHVCLVERLIKDALDDWQREIRGYRAVDTIKQLRDSTQELSEHELARAIKALESGKPADEVLQQLSRNLTNKFLHAPTVALRSAAEQGDLSLIEATHRLFTIDDIEDLD